MNVNWTEKLDKEFRDQLKLTLEHPVTMVAESNVTQMVDALTMSIKSKNALHLGFRVVPPTKAGCGWEICMVLLSPSIIMDLNTKDMHVMDRFLSELRTHWTQTREIAEIIKRALRDAT